MLVLFVCINEFVVFRLTTSIDAMGSVVVSIEPVRALPAVKNIISYIDSAAADVFRKTVDNSDVEVGIEILHQFTQGKRLL